MELKEQTYWVIHLRNGVSLYTNDDGGVLLPDDRGMCAVRGLDDEPYHFPADAIMLVHRSTPASRAFYVRLTVGLTEEMQNEKAALLEKVMKQAGMAEHGVNAARKISGSAVDLVRRGSKPTPD